MDRRTVEGIEACRPGSDDLRAPELDHLARQVQQDPEAKRHYMCVQRADAAVADAMDQVQVPSGLADRILARLTAAEADVNPTCGIPQRTSRWSRRRAVAIVTSVAAALLIAAFFSRWLSTEADSPLEDLAEGWMVQLRGHWQAAEGAPADLAVPSVVTAPAVGWQRFGQLNSFRGVAYKLTRQNAGTATLFVLRASLPSLPGLPPAPPLSPQSTTGGKAIGYWRSGPLVYVLVVEGNERSYRGFVTSSSPPLA